MYTYVRKSEDVGKQTMSEKEEEDMDSKAETVKDRVTQDLDVLSESLVMSFVEAFFLSYGLGCLLVDADNGGTDEAALEELWHRYRQLDSNFVDNYVAYHHFRSKGWVPRSGIKFGTDYSKSLTPSKEGPPFYHASYSVLVRPVVEGTFGDGSERTKEFGWSTLAGLNRITEQAAKELLVCYVIRPRDVDVTTPNCLSQFKVQETLVKRWVSNEERTEAELS